MPEAGDLSERSPQELYYLAASSQLTGRLAISAHDRTFELWFRKGSPQYVESDHPDDSLDGFLVFEQLCQPHQLAQAHEAKDRFGGELLAALFALGLINPNTALQQLARRGLTLLGHMLLVEHGAFSWSSEELPAAKAIPLGNRWAAYLEPLRRVPFVELQRRMVAAMNLPIMKSGGRVPLEELRLTPQEARALTFFDGVRSLYQLVSDAPSDADTMLSTAWMLRPLELVSFAGTPQPTAAPPRAAAPPQASAIPGPPPAARVPGPPPAARVPGPPPAAGVPGPPPAVRVPGPPPAAGVPGPPPAARVPDRPPPRVYPVRRPPRECPDRRPASPGPATR